ncbi:MAG: arginase [Nitrospinaceae bacterium]|nr:MAG: arginase [Nitrospinaceae bacterium]
MTDIRLWDIIGSGESGHIVLLGFPHDQGVSRNGGRAGARLGPEKFRFWLKRFGTAHNPEKDTNLSSLSITDAGDIPPEISLEDAHTRLTEQVRSILTKGGIPFIVGGGNDQSYPNASALLHHQEGRTVGAINIDAHLDVRPLKDERAHSGSSFRQLLDDDRFDGENFIEFGAQGSQCSQEHAGYVRNKKGRILWLDEVQHHGRVVDSFKASIGNLSWKCTSLFVSFDLDSIAGSDAPGVSCPGILGLNAEDAISIAFCSGSHSAVSLFDLSEYNPLIEDERTGRLAAALFYYFCLGVASRKENQK